MVGKLIIEIALDEQRKIADKYEPGSAAVTADKAFAAYEAAHRAELLKGIAASKKEEKDYIYLSY
jgi:hypothetical protein